MIAVLLSASALEAQQGPSADCARVPQLVAASEAAMAADSVAGAVDFTAVDSREKAEELWRRGALEKLFLMPLDFGGEDLLPNTVFVPIGIAAIKARVDNDVIVPLADDGQISQYSARPEYRGTSFIPAAITIRASDPGEFSCTIRVWGDAVARHEST